MSNTFFTSDTHFGHARIIEYCDRPFANVKEMNEAMIDNWNSVVKPDDVVFHLGDFAFADPENFLDRLNGRKRLVLGNHDKSITGNTLKKFEWVKPYAEVYINDSTLPPTTDRWGKKVADGRQHIVLMHYAMRVWNKSHHGSWMLYGHSHGSLPDDPNALSIDVGVDSHNFRPVSYEEVKQIMSSKQFKPVDHHGR